MHTWATCGAILLMKFLWTYSCLVDSTLKVLNASSHNIQRFSFQAFRFVGNYKYVYFHCHVIACNGDDTKSTCARGCVKEKPTKREVKRKAVRLIQGPFVLKERDNEDVWNGNHDNYRY
jgi:hypothetical protein